MRNSSIKISLFALLLILLLSSSLALPVSQITMNGYVIDKANVISEKYELAMTNYLEQFHQNNIAQISIVTVDNFDTLSKEEYALTLAHENLGDTQKDNGLLILIGVEPREYRIEVGYGLEGDLNDAKVGRLARELLVPHIQNNEYDIGLALFIEAIGKELIPNGYIPTQQEESSSSSNNWWGWFIILFIIFRMISAQSSSRSKSRAANDAFSAAMIASWFFRGGGGSGGFGGFGGGGFGGGGAGGNFN